MKIFLLFLFILSHSVLSKGHLQPLGEVIKIHEKIEQGKSTILNRPTHSYQKLTIWEREGKSGCLVYKIPGGNEKGQLFFIPISKSSCELGDIENHHLLFDGIKELGIEDIELKKNPQYRVRMSFEKEDKSFLVLLPFFRPEYSRWPGITPYKVKTSNKEKRDLPNGEVCLTYNKFCVSEGNNCGRCRSGRFSTFSNLLCPSKVYAVCGEDECGGKGQYACLKMTALVQTLECEKAKHHFYCQIGAEIECSVKGKVICR